MRLVLYVQNEKDEERAARIQKRCTCGHKLPIGPLVYEHVSENIHPTCL